MRTDFHSHILPGIDDGSASVEESLAMLRMEAQQGIRRVVATPHFYPRYDAPEKFLQRAASALEQLRGAMALRQELPEIVQGAEVYYFPGISDCEDLPQLTIGQKHCILIEMPAAPWTNQMFRELEGIYVKWGLTPVIAHIDRYIRPFQTHGIPERLRHLPVLIQANSEFFLEKATQRMALRMLRGGQIHLLGSDCHNVSSRKPDLGAALTLIEKRLGAQALAGIDACGQEVLGLTTE